MEARQLTKHDYRLFRPLFALYLDIQKQKDLYSMNDTEARGRWKSFLGKWNRGELSEGWYDPVTFQRAVEEGVEGVGRKPVTPEDAVAKAKREVEKMERDESDSDASIGPVLPGQEGKSGKRVGPTVPNLQELMEKRENESEEAFERRKAERDDVLYARKQERKAQKERMDELVPRAEAGTRERQLEKKREVNAKMALFRDKSPGAAVDVPDSELMGGGDSMAEFKQRKQEEERKKSERELRREEFQRARAAEREERLGAYREKEDKTMEMLKELARSRFGPGAG